MTAVSLLEMMRRAVGLAQGGPEDGPSLRARAGQRLFFQEDPADAVYLLTSGRVALTTVPANEEEGALSLLCRAPAVIGDRDLLLGLTAREGAQCLVASELSVWDAEAFREEWEAAPELQSWLSWDLSRRYARTLELQRLLQRPLAFRVVAALRELSDTEGLASTRELAALLGATEKSVLRSLAWLRERGVVSPADEEGRSALAELSRFEELEDLASVTLFHHLSLPPKAPQTS